MATFTKRGTKWQVKCRKKGYKTVSKTFSLKYDAERWAREVELAMEQRVFESTKTAEVTLVSSLLDRFWDDVASKYKSAVGVQYTIAYLKKVFGHIHLIDLDGDVAKEFKDYRLEKVSGDTVRKEMSLMKRMIDYSIRELKIHLPKGNPFNGISFPAKGKARDRRLHQGEFEIIKNEAEHYGGYISIVFELAIETAMRRGEIIGLNWKNIDLKKRIAHLPETKNGSSRIVPLSKRAIELLNSLDKT